MAVAKSVFFVSSAYPANRLCGSGKRDCPFRL